MSYESKGFGACGPNGVLKGKLNGLAKTKFGFGKNQVDIDMACHFHDMCYSVRCDLTKKRCDELFLRHMLQICKLSSSNITKNVCEQTSNLYYKAVLEFGDFAFNQSRKETCATIRKVAFKRNLKMKTNKLLLDLNNKKNKPNAFKNKKILERNDSAGIKNHTALG
jgi:hypothetical protein